MLHRSLRASTRPPDRNQILYNSTLFARPDEPLAAAHAGHRRDADVLPSRPGTGSRLGTASTKRSVTASTRKGRRTSRRCVAVLGRPSREGTSSASSRSRRRKCRRGRAGAAWLGTSWTRRRPRRGPRSRERGHEGAFAAERGAHAPRAAASCVGAAAAMLACGAMQNATAPFYEAFTRGATGGRFERRPRSGAATAHSRRPCGRSRHSACPPHPAASGRSTRRVQRHSAAASSVAELPADASLLLHPPRARCCDGRPSARAAPTR